MVVFILASIACGFSPTVLFLILARAVEGIGGALMVPVSMDMSAPYRPAVQLCLPKALIVVAHFHVIQHVMKGFKKVLQSWAHKKEGKPLLEGKQALFNSVRWHSRSPLIPIPMCLR
jgi:hypothetical protein